MESGNVECLGCSGKHYGAVAFFCDTKSRSVPAPAKDEVVVDLIGNYSHIVMSAYFKHMLQLFFRPHSADRIVRRAEQKSLNRVFLDLFLKIFKINIVAGIFVYQF